MSDVFRVSMVGFILLLWPAMVGAMNGGARPAPPSQARTTPLLSLNGAIQLALERNPDVRRAENALLAAEAARRVAVGKLYPSIKARSWYELFPTQAALLLPRVMFTPSLSQIAAPTSQQTQQNMLNFQRDQFQDWVFNIGLGLNWPLYAGGRFTAEVKAKDAEVSATAYRRDRIHQQLAFAVTQTYLSILVLQSTEQAERASIRHLTNARSDLDTFVVAGKRPRLDVLRIEARLALVRRVLADIQAQLATAQSNLRRLLDFDPSGPPLKLVDMEGITGGDAVKNPPQSVAIDQALANRPDYRALQYEVDSQRARLHVAQGERLPEVDLSARVWEAHGNRTGGPISTWEPDSQIVLSASVPIFTGGTLSANVDHEHARLSEMNDRLAGLAQRVRWEVTQAYAELRAARTGLPAAQAAVKSAGEAFRVERVKVAVGAGVVTDLLDAQAADLEASTGLYQAQAAVRAAEAHLELAMGVLNGRSDAAVGSIGE